MENKTMWASPENVAVHGWAISRGYLEEARELLADRMELEEAAGVLAEKIMDDLADGLPDNIADVYRDLLEAAVKKADYMGIATTLCKMANYGV